MEILRNHEREGQFGNFTLGDIFCACCFVSHGAHTPLLLLPRVLPSPDHSDPLERSLSSCFSPVSATLLPPSPAYTTTTTTRATTTVINSATSSPFFHWQRGKRINNLGRLIWLFASLNSDLKVESLSLMSRHHYNQALFSMSNSTNYFSRMVFGVSPD